MILDNIYREDIYFIWCWWDV